MHLIGAALFIEQNIGNSLASVLVLLIVFGQKTPIGTTVLKYKYNFILILY